MLTVIEKISIYHDEQGHLCCRSVGSGARASDFESGPIREHRVEIHRLFPWSHPSGYFSLRTSKGEEVALVVSMSDVDLESQRELARALEISGFYFEVVGIRSVEEEYELRHWCVETRQGIRRFQTALDDFPVELPQGGLMIQDIQRDVYVISDPRGLPEPGRSLLWAFID